MISRYSFTALLLLILGLHSDPARALCWTTPENLYATVGNMNFSVTAPLPIPIGGLLVDRRVNFVSEPTLICNTRSTVRLVAANEGGLVPGNGPGRYLTGIPGVELEIGFGYTPDTVISMHTGWETTLNMWQTVSAPRTIIMRMIRTGSHVARAGHVDIVGYTAQLRDGANVIQTFEINGRFTFSQDVLLMSCTADRRETTVPMGTTSIASLRADNSPVRSYALDIGCEGGAPDAPPPVKVFFVGDTTPDGILRLSDLPDSASGVGIAVTSADDKPLPFADRSRALDLTWLEKANGVDRYRFEGRAKYVSIPGAGEPKAGRADAVMTYVLDYN